MRPTARKIQSTSDASVTFFGGGTVDNASSVTLRDPFLRHDRHTDKTKCTRIPSTIVPALLQSVGEVSPPLTRTDAVNEARVVDESDSDSEDALPRFTAAHKEKWKATTDENDAIDDGSQSPDFFHFPSVNNTVEEWVTHTRPILQEYADRQVSLPLGRRLDVSIDTPSKSIVGALQLLANRDKGDCHPSRRLGPLLIENFVDVDRWAKEYLRSRHAMQPVDNDISALLTIVLNNFYEGQVQLIDRMVAFALEHMRFSGRSILELEDFSFGFDFRMSQDLPFYVETASRMRKAYPIPSVEVDSIPEYTTTSSGRLVKLSKRALDSMAQARATASRGRTKTKAVSREQAEPAPALGLAVTKKKSQKLARPCVDKTVPTTPDPKTVALTKHVPIRPSNLGLPPISRVSSSSGPESPERKGERTGDDTNGECRESFGAVSGANVGNAPSSSSLAVVKFTAAKHDTVEDDGNKPEEASVPENPFLLKAAAQTTRRSERVRVRPSNSRGRTGGRACERSTASTKGEGRTRVGFGVCGDAVPTRLGVLDGTENADAVVGVRTARSSDATIATGPIPILSVQPPPAVVDVQEGSHKTDADNRNGKGAGAERSDPGHPRRKKRKLEEMYGTNDK